MSFQKAERRSEQESTALPETGTPEESIPRSLVPYSRDDDRSRYLGLRSSGFTIREALGLIGKAKSTLSLWRHNSVFLDLENRIPELRKTLALEYASLEFLRNYRLILEKDYRVIKGSLVKKTVLDKEGNSHTVPMDSQDFQYLLKARAHYTPEQLRAIEQLFETGDSKKSFNWFEDFVLTATRTREEVKIETRHRSVSELAPIVEGESEEIVLDASETQDNTESQ